MSKMSPAEKLDSIALNSPPISSSSGLFMLDTNIISDLMRGTASRASASCRRAIQKGEVTTFCTSVVVQCELLFGLTKRPSDKLQAAYVIEMSKLQVLPLTPDIAAHYAELRTQLEALGTLIGPNNALIAAHALAMNATLVTGEAEFLRVPGLRVENWLALEEASASRAGLKTSQNKQKTKQINL